MATNPAHPDEPVPHHRQVISDQSPARGTAHGEVNRGLQMPATSKFVIYFRKLAPGPIQSALAILSVENGKAKWHIKRHFANFKG